MSDSYERHDPVFRGYVDTLLQHARGALWPERRAALESFYRGIGKTDADALLIAAQSLGVEARSASDAAEVIFRRLLTIYLHCLAEAEVTNPDQAHLYAMSLDPTHVELAELWIDRHRNA